MKFSFHGDHEHVTVHGMRKKHYSARRRSGLFTFGAAVVALLHCGTTLAASADPIPSPLYPVPYNFIFDAIGSTFDGASAAPPGTNIWSCRPSAAHPEPVILVHGVVANRNNNWQTYGPLLANNGYCVYALNYGNEGAGSSEGIIGGLGSMRDSAVTLGAFVDRVLTSTGASKAAIVGHSEGATMPHWYLKFGNGSSKVSKMVSLASLVHGLGGTTGAAAEGSNSGSSGSSDSGSSGSSGSGSSGGSSDGAFAEFSASSSFMRELNQGPITVPGVAYTQIVTRNDQIVTPYTSGLIDEPGVVNVTVQDLCAQDMADHTALVSDPVAARVVLNALDPTHPQPVPCTLVLPWVGALGTGSGSNGGS